LWESRCVPKNTGSDKNTEGEPNTRNVWGGGDKKKQAGMGRTKGAKTKGGGRPQAESVLSFSGCRKKNRKIDGVSEDEGGAPKGFCNQVSKSSWPTKSWAQGNTQHGQKRKNIGSASLEAAKSDETDEPKNGVAGALQGPHREEEKSRLSIMRRSGANPNRGT